MSTPLQGRGAAGGVALAPAFVVVDAPRPRRSDPADTAGESPDPDEERRRAERALAQTAENLEALAAEVSGDVGATEGEIFLAQASFARDPELVQRVQAAIAGGASAAQAVGDAFDGFRTLLEGSDNEYLAARAGDIADVRTQVLDLLAGVGPARVPASRCVVVAADLTPSQTARLPHELIAGIACAGGSPTSHAAILARALGIPAVMGVQGLLAAAADGLDVALDGAQGSVVVAPDAKERERFAARERHTRKRRDALAALRDEPCVTADGRRVELAANLGDPEEVDAARTAGAEGSGLVRTELLFLDAAEAPTLEAQTDFYQRVLAGFPRQRVVFRTLDIGADKPVPFVERGREDNPALGLRGIRLGLARPELLRTQLRALLRAHALEPQGGHLGVMFPLVSRTDEVDRAVALLEEAADAEGVDIDDVEIGVMVEVPAAALAADRLAARLDFLSVGTNDLLQYLFAADRLTAAVADVPDLFEPGVLRLLGEVVAGAHRHDAWVGVCGEAATDPLSALAFVGLDVDELSGTPAALPEVKDTLRRVRHRELQAAVADAITSEGPAAARAAVARCLPPSDQRP